MSNKTAVIVCIGAVVVFVIGNFNVLLLTKYNLSSNTSKDALAAIMASSLWCAERINGTKSCSFKNLYYLPQFKDHFVFVLNEHSILTGINSSQTLKKIGLSTITNHPGLYLKLVILKSHKELLQNNFEYFDDVMLMKRFKPDNIMHVIHDDLIPLFLTYREICKGDIELCFSYKLIFFDENDLGPHYRWYKYFSHHDPVYIKSVNKAVCIKKGVFGLSHEGLWYQYGFKTLQGPVLNSRFNGILLNQFTTFIKHQFGIEEQNELSELQPTVQVVLLSRKINRKILNEDTLEAHIKEICHKRYNKPVNIINMDISTNSSASLVSSLHATHLLIGMHGSAMILGMFLPQGSTIIELFPFGIQPKHVSPLKALCSLPFTFLNYNAWVNSDESNSVSHPEYPPLLGGLWHLPPRVQLDIINTKLVPAVECCHNPLYLFRMFQDTVVDKSLYLLLQDVLINESSTQSEPEFTESVQKHLYNSWYFPPPVFNLSCKCTQRKLKISWDFPHPLPSNIKFSLVTSTGLGLVTEYTQFSTETKKCQSNDSGTWSPVQVWVKTVEGHQESIDSYTQCI